MIKLSELAEGEEAKLVSLEGNRSFRRRLMELGLLPGTGLRVIRRGTFGGVLELEVRRSRLSLRMSEAAHLFLEEGSAEA